MRVQARSWRGRILHPQLARSSDNASFSRPATASAAASARPSPEEALTLILATLDDAKAEDAVTIDLHDKSSIGDYMVVASGRSDRHVGAIVDRLVKALKEAGAGGLRVEGLPHCDWVLVDAGDIIVHVFRPEVRTFYNLEKMWSANRPMERAAG